MMYMKEMLLEEYLLMMMWIFHMEKNYLCRFRYRWETKQKAK